MSKACRKGQILRASYTTKKGKKVKAGCIKDEGLPGKGPKTLPKPRKGALTRFLPKGTVKTWTTVPQSVRRAALKKAIQQEGITPTQRHLQLILNLSANSKNPGTQKAVTVYRKDIAWLQGLRRKQNRRKE